MCGSEGVTLKKLSFYLGYGSYKEMHGAYSIAAPSGLRMGQNTFQELVAAVARKDAYNQGLLYFNVDFVDMIELLLKMLERVKSIIKRNPRISKQTESCLRCGSSMRKRTQSFQISTYVMASTRIQKKSTDCYCCDAHALGEEGNHNHSYAETTILDSHWCTSTTHCFTTSVSSQSRS
jgi:hypothetical protein